MRDPIFDDALSRRAIREELDVSMIVEAAAGTGKTSELVRRVVQVLARGKTTVDRLVAVTFTRKAAGELKLRLRQDLDRARLDAKDEETRARLEHAIGHLEEARIGTIHGFCGELLRERPVEARVDPRFDELTEGEAERIYEQAFRRGLEQILADMPDGVHRALLRKGGGFDAKSPTEKLRDAAWRLIEWRDFPAPWRREPFDRLAAIARAGARVDELGAIAARARTKDDLSRSLEPLLQLARSPAWRASSSPSGADEREASLVTLLAEMKKILRQHKRLGRGVFADGISREDVAAMRDALISELEVFKRDADAELAALLQRELAVFRDRYAEIKRRSGKLDFVDLLVFVRDLLRDDAAVRRYFQERFTHIFIDEFQDTDPLQAEILMLLAADDPWVTDWRKVRAAPGKLFLVGDPKQSIYRFRRADIHLYQTVKRILVESGALLAHLKSSFRATAPIQHAINAAFSEVIVESTTTGQPSYVALEGGPEATAERPSIVALPVPRPFGTRGISKAEIDKSLPDTIAAYVSWLVKTSGWTIRDPEKSDGRVPIAPRHICVLFRRYVSYGRDLTRDLVHALEARNVPHILVGGRSFHHRDEVETLRAALSAIERPDDELSVFATLKGSLFAISDDVLFRFRAKHKMLHPFRPVIGATYPRPDELEDEFAVIREALWVLADLHKRRNRRPIVETLGALLEATRAHAGFALRPDGQQVLANVQRVLDLARSFEIGGGLSFRGFVEHLNREAEAERRVEAPLLEEGAEGVRIMTVHAAKGLEFPAVILGDLTTNLAAQEPDRYVDQQNALFATKLFGCMPRELAEHAPEELERDRAEGVRIAYVAATRARDLLVVPALGVEAMDGWFGALNRAIYPPADRWRKPQPAPGCPTFGDRTVLQSDPRDMGPVTHSVRPGLHAGKSGDYAVAWWDPQTLDLGVHADFGVRQELMLKEDEGGRAVAAALERYRKWRAERNDEVEVGSKKSIEPFGASDHAAPTPPPYPGAIQEIVLDRDPARPGGTRFGTLVHTILRDVAYDAAEPAIAALALTHGRMLGAPEVEMQAASIAVARALAPDVMLRARRAERCHRELPIAFRTQAGKLLDGTIDLAFYEGDTWFVVDFKTDADLSERRAHYETQVRWYLVALSNLLRAPCRGILLAV